MTARLVLLACLLAAGHAHAQQEALVLSGGGARGLAHVGVIRRLHELGYDPDIVVGNSMGAVVGALYAAGYDVADIERRIRAVNWARMFDPTPVVIGPARTLRSPLLVLDVDIADLRASRGLFGQWRVNRALAALLFDANARTRGDFDLLPRRFRAMAADLTTGLAVPLDSGDIARAVRASMAYPGFFAPVMWGDRLLTDGGIAENFPVPYARTLGATHVVGVNVGRPAREISTLAPLSIAGRSLSLMQLNLERHDAPPDQLVAPIFEMMSVGPFFPADPVPIIEIGYAAAQRDLSGFRPSVTSSSGARTLPPPPSSFSALIIEAPDSALAAMARRTFGGLIGRPYDAADVLRAVDRLYATGLVEGVWPRVVSSSDADDAPALLVRIEAPPAVSLSVGAHYENDRGGRAWTSLDRNGRIARLPAVFSLAATGGSLERWGTAALRVHAQRAVAFSAGAHVLEQSVRSFEDDVVRTKESLRAGGWLGLEFPHILRDRLVVAAARGEWIETEDGADGAAIGPFFRFTEAAPETRVVGMPFLIEAERRWGSLTYTRARFSGWWTAGARGPLFAAGVDVSGVSSVAPEDVKPALGDDHAIPGLRWGMLRGRARIVGGVDAALPIRSAYGRVRVRSGTIVDDLHAWHDTRWVTGGELGVFWQTPLGDLEVGYGLATRGDGRLDVSIGRGF